jgi:trimeric autotransporter adhesin
LVATINNLGLATTIGVGSTQISATLNGISGTLTLNIGNAVVESIEVNAPSTLSVGATSQLTAVGTFSDSSQQNLSSQVSWSSDNPGVGIVSSTGEATGVSAGSFDAVATLNGISGSASIAITSAAPPTLVSITVTPANITLLGSIYTLLGTSTQFTATGHYSDGSTLDLTSSVQWSTSNGSAASINSQGQLQLTLSGLLGLVGLGSNTINVNATQGSVSGSTNIFLTVL